MQKELTPIKVFRPKGGESWEDVFNRARRFLNIILILHLLKVNEEGEEKKEVNILTITHGGWIMEFVDYLKYLNNLPQNTKNATGNTAIYYVKVWF